MECITIGNSFKGAVEVSISLSLSLKWMLEYVEVRFFFFFFLLFFCIVGEKCISKYIGMREEK